MNNIDIEERLIILEDYFHRNIVKLGNELKSDISDMRKMLNFDTEKQDNTFKPDCNIKLKKGDNKMRKNLLDMMNEEQLREFLYNLIERLDELSSEDFFGTEGWERYLGYDE